MSTDYPVDSLAAAVHAACLRDLPEIKYKDRDWPAHRRAMEGLSCEERAAFYAKERQSGQVEGHFIERTRRPHPGACRVVMFPQAWGSTALGFGGIGGQAVTSAYTVIVECRHTGCKAVYFSGQLAYLVPQIASGKQRTRFAEDMAKQQMAPCAQAGDAYGAVGHNPSKVAANG